MSNPKQLLLDSPIIAAVKDEASLARALDSECQVIFLLYGSILNIEYLVQRIRIRGKCPIVHLDLVEGLANREIAVDAIMKFCRPDGIISTRPGQIRRAQQMGLLTIQRQFLLDSMSLESLRSQVESCRPDFIEVLPGIIPSVIQEISRETPVPIIAGGLIRSKQDVIQALHAGAIAVSTTCQQVWSL